MTAKREPAKKSTKPRKIAPISSNSEALSEMLSALDDAGRLEKVDAARIQIARRLAQAVDENPENVGLWQQYRAAEAVLREVTNDDSDGLADLFARFDAEVRNAENTRPQKPRG